MNRILKLQLIFAPDNGIPLKVYTDMYKNQEKPAVMWLSKLHIVPPRIGEVNVKFCSPTPKIQDVSGPSFSKKIALCKKTSWASLRPKNESDIWLLNVLPGPKAV